MTDAVIEIDHVTKTFDDLVAVDEVHLSVPDGQTLGLIGPNGAGKTTLLRIICSLAKPDRGDIRIHGESVREHPRATRKLLGFMPAEFGSPRNFTIYEYLQYFSCLHDVPRAQRDHRIEEVCELTDLSGRESVMVKGLSTGNRQRLLLAKTLLHDPQILVLDEPASGLDPRARTQLRGIVRALAGMGKTIIISSHILPDIEEISDRIGILEAGRLVVDGELDALRAHHGKGTQRTVKLRVPEEAMGQAASVLTGLDGVTSCEERDRVLVVDTDRTNCNFVLAALIAADIHILEFSEDQPNLEEIFMRSTAGKVT